YYADAETGMFYLPARCYDPATYRFLSQDPAAPSAGDPLSLNAYAYCSGNPVSFVDSTGATMEINDNGRLDAEESREQNKQSKKTKTSSDPAGIGAAAASTVFGVLDWTAKNRAAYMTKQMWDLYRRYLAAYGPTGPVRRAWSDYSQEASDLVRSTLLGHGVARRMPTWRSPHKPHEPWDDLDPIGQAAMGYAVSEMVVCAGGLAALGGSLIMGAGAAAAGLAGAAAVAAFAVPVLLGSVFVAGALFVGYGAYRVVESQFPNTVGTLY
ncbi:MAG: RHS repeat-associated core domain-containing protein, partial [Coriobacteriia bacterium]